MYITDRKPFFFLVHKFFLMLSFIYIFSKKNSIKKYLQSFHEFTNKSYILLYANKQIIINF